MLPEQVAQKLGGIRFAESYSFGNKEAAVEMMKEYKIEEMVHVAGMFIVVVPALDPLDEVARKLVGTLVTGIKNYRFPSTAIAKVFASKLDIEKYEICQSEEVVVIYHKIVATAKSPSYDIELKEDK